MTVTLTTDITNAIYTSFLKKEFQDIAIKELVMEQFGEETPIPKGMGKTLRLLRARKLARQDANLTEGTEPTSTSKLVFDYVEATLEVFGDFLELTEEDLLYPVANAVEKANEILAAQYAESIDWRIMKQVAPFISHIRTDAPGTTDEFLDESKNVTATGPNSTTSFTTNLTEANDYWDNAYLTFTSGVNYGITKPVDNFVSINGVTSFTAANAFPQAPATSDKFIISRLDGLAATADNLASSGIRRAQRFLKKYNAKRPIKTANGPYWAAVVDEDVESDLLGDATAGGFLDSKYTDFGPIQKGLIGRLFGSQFYLTTQPYREATTQAQSDSGAVHSNLFLGKLCYGMSKVTGDEGRGPAALRTWINRPGPQTMGRPMRQVAAELAWKARHITQVANALWGVNCVSTASA